jgi:PTS system nitrogen regulatory IIA component
MLRLSERMVPGAVLRLPEARSRQEVLPALVRAACSAHGLADPDRILSMVLERESKMPTAVGLGIAVPHARIDGLADLHVGVAICASGLDFPVSDGAPVRLAILLLSPTSAAGLHVKALAAVGRISADRVEDLVGSRDGEDFLARWGLWESRMSNA